MSPNSALRWPLRLALLVIALAWVSGSARAEHGFPGAMDEARAIHIRRALEPTRAQIPQLQLLHRRAPVNSLDVLVVGCDFADSLMVGRDRTDFPGWPAAVRLPQHSPFTGLPMFAAHDSLYFDLQMQRVSAYFETVSFGKFELRWDVHGEIVNLSEPMGYYGDDDSSSVRLARMAQDVADAIDADVDFSAYDTVLLIHAGAGRETDIDGDSPAQIFSNYLDASTFAEAMEAGLVESDALVTDEARIGHVLILPESETQDPSPVSIFSGFFDVRGVFCYELGLRMGMLSLADFTPSSYPDSQGIGNFGLMGYGLFTGIGIVPSAPCAMNRALVGWVEPVEVMSDATFRLGPMTRAASDAGDTLLVKVPINDREYFLLEYRLQDVDGNLSYTFGDLNGNNYPDYLDASSPDSIPESIFDPSEDTWEGEIGAEWDFFMSENPVRSADRCQNGGGSGVFIWHIDENAIEAALLAGTNTVNSDARRKGVDVEEADGIQDLDSSQGSPWLLGGDEDSWRAETVTEFGPHTAPSTASNSGIASNIRFSEFSTVVQEALPKVDGNCTGYVYRPHMRMKVEFGTGSASAPQLQAQLRFDGRAPIGQLRLADLGAAPGNANDDGAMEIVTLADSGRVLVLDGNLAAWSSGGPIASEPEVFAIAHADTAPRWVGGPVIGDLDGDGAEEIIASAADAIYGFGSSDGNEIMDGDANAASVGVLSALAPSVSSSSALLDGTSVLQPIHTESELRLRGLAFTGTNMVMSESGAIAGGPRAGATLVDDTSGTLALPWSSGEAGGYAWFSHSDGRGGAVVLGDLPPSTSMLWTDLHDLGASLAFVDSSGRAAIDQLEIPSQAGSAATKLGVVERSGFAEVGTLSAMVSAPSQADGGSVVFAYATSSALIVLDANMSVRSGFPYRIARGVIAPEPSFVAAPLLVDLDDDGELDFIWQDPDGGVHALDLQGRLHAGWPILGPADPPMTGAVGDVDGDGELDLVLAGRFDRLIAPDDDGVGFQSRTVGELRVYSLSAAVTAYTPWAQARGDAAGTNRQTLTTTGASSTAGEQFSLRPNPVVGGLVRVRVEVAARADVYVEFFTMEGQSMGQHGPFPTPAGTAFDREFTLEGFSSGLYLCRIRAGGEAHRLVLAVVR